MRASLVWQEPTVAEVGAPTKLCAIPKNKCKPPAPKSKPRRPAQAAQSSTDAQQPEDDNHDADSDDEVNKLAQDLRSALHADSIEELEWLDALASALGVESAESADKDDEPDDICGAPAPSDTPSAAPPSSGPSVVVVAADTKWQDGFLKSVDVLQRRSAAFTEALTWHCTPAARRYAASLGCNHPLIGTCKEKMAMALVVDNSSIPRVVHYPTQRTQQSKLFSVVHLYSDSRLSVHVTVKLKNPEYGPN